MIYCVEDDDAIRNLEIYALEGASLPAKGFPDGESFWQAVRLEMPQLVILDVMLPGEDGLAILRRLRSQPETAALPVLMASAKGAEYDKVTGLDSGADDYIAKPFGMMELVSRVRALLRRAQRAASATDTALRCGDLTLDAAGHRVFAQGSEILLTRKEYDLLELLMRSPDRVFTRDALLCAIWGYGFDGETRTVDVHVRTLRQKLGEAGAQIGTVRGVGYRISATPQEDAAEPAKP